MDINTLFLTNKAVLILTSVKAFIDQATNLGPVHLINAGWNFIRSRRVIVIVIVMFVTSAHQVADTFFIQDRLDCNNVF